MAKIYGLFGAMSGKVADVVMSVRNGQQIVRKYQPVVSNPKTANQYTTRARFKLVSQLSASLAPFIAIKRQGGVSGRNIFFQINFPYSSFEGDEAHIDMLSVQITNSRRGFPALRTTAQTATEEMIYLSSDVEGIDRVVYVIATRNAKNEIVVVDSAVVEKGEVSGHPFSYISSRYTYDSYVFSYGLVSSNLTKSTRFGNIELLDASSIAKLVVYSSDADVEQLITATSSATIPAASRDLSDNDKKKSSKSQMIADD